MSKPHAKGTKNGVMPADIPLTDPTLTVPPKSEHECVDVNPSDQQLTDAHEEAIRVLAHEKWEAAGCPAGNGIDFWLEAEREVTAKQSGLSTDQGKKESQT